MTCHRYRARLLVGCLLFLTSACEVPVASNLAESDANQVVVALTSQNIVSTKARDPQNEGQFQVSVPESDVPLAIGALHSAGLPLEARPGVLQALGEGGLVASRKSEEARLVAGIAGDLETSLRAVDGILAARVHLAVPPDDPFSVNDEPLPASASVLLRHRGNTPPLGERDVQRLVAGALTGLSPDRVAVVSYPTLDVPAERSQNITKLGPLALTASSAPLARSILAAAAILNVLWVVLVSFLWVRLKQSRQREAPEGAH